MSAPKRIQRKRTKGWRMPKGAVYVGRPSNWGNPFAIGGRAFWRSMGVVHEVLILDAETAVRLYRNWIDLDGRYLADTPPDASAIRTLRGLDLVCWCPLDQPCHADVLLELANGASSTERR